jgi:hypothetical protein
MSERTYKIGQEGEKYSFSEVKDQVKDKKYNKLENIDKLRGVFMIFFYLNLMN